MHVAFIYHVGVVVMTSQAPKKAISLPWRALLEVVWGPSTELLDPEPACQLPKEDALH